MKLIGTPQSTSAGQNRRTYSTILGNATSGDTVFQVTYEQGRVDVFLNGVRLVPDQDFTRTANGIGTFVTLVSGISTGDYVDLVGHVGLASNAVSTDNFVVGTSSTGSGGSYTGSTTVFPVLSSGGDKVNFYLNGVLLDSTDYTVSSSGSTVTLSAAAATSDIVEIQVIGALVSSSSATFDSLTAASGTFTTFTSTGIDDNATSGPALTIDSSGNFTFNEDGNDSDFRVESDSQSHMLFVDAGQDSVKIGGTADVGDGSYRAELAVNGAYGQTYGNTSTWITTVSIGGGSTVTLGTYTGISGASISAHLIGHHHYSTSSSGTSAPLGVYQIMSAMRKAGTSYTVINNQVVDSYFIGGATIPSLEFNNSNGQLNIVTPTYQGCFAEIRVVFQTNYNGVWTPSY